MSPVILLSPFLLSLYSIISSLSLLLTWSITPLFFYVILTQSSKLKSFKWLIFNHSIWCLALETMIGLFKPIFVTPTFGGFPIGIFRDSDSPRVTCIFAIIGLMVGTNSLVSLAITVASRYSLAFPNRFFSWIKNNTFIILSIPFFVVINGIFLFAGFSTLALDEAYMRKLAIEYDSSLAEIIQQFPSFVFVPREFIALPSMIITFFIILAILIGLAIISYFIYLVKKSKTSTTSKLQYFLIISSIMQLLISFVFMLIPFAIIYGSIAFEIDNSAFLSSLLCVCLLSLHCLFEFLVTLYFVTPYRKFVEKLIYKYLLSSNPPNIPVTIAPVSETHVIIMN